MTYPAVIHCDSCAARFDTERPMGVIMLNRGDGHYHFVEDIGNTFGTTTGCGLSKDEFDSTVGTHFIELSADVLCSDWLRGATACPQCFANVW